MTPDAVGLALLGGLVLFGAATQRLTGMGFALVASPLLVLVLGAGLAVPLIQVLGMVASMLVLASVWRDVEPRKALALLLPALAGVLPGAWVVRMLPGPMLSILIGVLVIVSLVAMVASERARVFTGVPGLLSAGFLSGFMNVTAGVGGPAVVLYALSTKWRHEAFVATVQVYLIGLSLMSLVAMGWPALSAGAWVVAVAGLLVGLGLGEFLSRRVPAGAARTLMVAVALAGAAGTVVKGILELAG